MSRFLAALVAAACTAGLLAGTATAHQGSPNYSSVINRVTPQVPGVALQILNRDDRLQIRNHSAKTIVVYGYNDEPYVRLKPDGTVEVNRLSPAKALNEDRYGRVSTPKSADPKAPPQWQVVDRTGRFEWHDHRIHWMAKGTPPQVKDKGQRTKVFDWKVAFAAGGDRGTIAGSLFWVPDSGSGGAPTGAIVAFAAFLLLSVVAVVLVRRRRARAPGGGGDREAW
jgi:MYXO-CTERM domain-containing protein